MRFGVSTHLYRDHLLQQAHLLEIAAHGFDDLEVVATQGHFDYHNPDKVRMLGSWLADAHLHLHSIHAPSTDVVEIAAVLDVARIVPFDILVVHLGASTPHGNSREAALRTIEEAQRLANPIGVRVALEVNEDALSTPETLVDLIEGASEGTGLGICMDVGHAHMLGDPVEAIEAASEYVITTHIHDNRRQRDDHLVPFQGTVDWAATVMALEKIGYDGVLMFEVRDTGDPGAVLGKAVAARRRFQDLMIDNSLFL